MTVLSRIIQQFKPVVLILALFTYILISCITVRTKQSPVIPDGNGFIVPQEEGIYLSDFYFTADKRIQRGRAEDPGQTYKISIFFKGANPVFYVSCHIFDKERRLIFSRERAIPQPYAGTSHSYIIKGEFEDVFIYNEMYCVVEIFDNEKKYEYNLSYTNGRLPALKFAAGPVISQMIGKSRAVSLLLDISIENIEEIRWIHMIPPEKDSFWDIPFNAENGVLNALGNIYESDKNFINNGEYILQINLGAAGLIERKITVKDIYNNEAGPNYGLPVAVEYGSDRNSIRFDISFIEMLDHMELWIYENIEEGSQKLGTVKMAEPADNIKKSELQKSIKDEEGNAVKLRYNKEYSYRIHLYSKEFNGLKYMSISDEYKLVIQGFDFFNL